MSGSTLWFWRAKQLLKWKMQLDPRLCMDESFPSLTSKSRGTCLYSRGGGIEWSNSIKKCSQNLAFARIARKIKWVPSRSFPQEFCYCSQDDISKHTPHQIRHHSVCRSQSALLNTTLCEKNMSYLLSNVRISTYITLECFALTLLHFFTLRQPTSWLNNFSCTTRVGENKHIVHHCYR